MRDNDKSTEVSLALIWYHLRCNLHGHAVDEASERLRNVGTNKRNGDPQGQDLLSFWKACSSGLANHNLHEAIWELETVRRRTGAKSGRRRGGAAAGGGGLLDFPVIVALVHFRQRLSSRPDDNTAIDGDDDLNDLEFAAGAAQDAAPAEAIVLAARFLLFADDPERARRLVSSLASRKRSLGSATNDENETATDQYAVQAWVELCLRLKGGKSHDDLKLTVAVERLEAAARARRASLDSLMALATYYNRKGDQSTAVDCLNQAIAVDDLFFPAVIEKAKVFLSAKDFDQATQATQRLDATSLARRDVEAMRTATLVRMVTNGDVSASEASLRRLIDGMERREEPPNATLCLQTSRLFARLSRKAVGILKLTLRLAERARDADPSNGIHHEELGFQHSMLGNYDAALNAYQTAIEVDETNMRALHGMIRCQIQKGDLEDAEQQVEFISLIQEKEESHTPELFYIQALLAMKKHGCNSHSFGLLQRAIEIQTEQWKGGQQQSGQGVFHEYASLRPDFLMDAATECLRHADSVPDGADLSTIDAAQQAFVLLKLITDSFPGYTDAWLLTSKAFLENERTADSKETINRCISFSAQSGLPHLVLAQVQLSEKDITAALQSLEQALSMDFILQNHPLYLLVRSELILASHQEESGKAKEMLQMALKQTTIQDRFCEDSILSDKDRLSCFILLSQLCRTKEAKLILAQAQRNFKGTRGEIRIMEAQSDLYLNSGNVKKALRVLNVPSDSPMYLPAQVAKASIHLETCRDKNAYIQCLVDVTKASNTSASFKMLGEAYMRIQSPKAAIEAFERSYEKDPNDVRLVEMIGRAMIATHDYQRAKQHFEGALRNHPHSTSLRSDLARLYLQLGEHDKAMATLSSVSTGGDTKSVSTLLLIADALLANRQSDKAKEVLLGAKELQKAAIGPNQGASQLGTYSAICINLGKCFESECNFAEAEASYTEALEIGGQDEKSMIALAKLCLQTKEYEKCKTYCEKLLVVDPTNDQTLSVMTDSMSHQLQLTEALSYAKRFLSSKPCDCNALAKCVLLLWRLGETKEIQPMIQAAERAGCRGAGLSFVKGLSYRCTNNLPEALKQFSLARKDAEWQDRAVENMIEIYFEAAENGSFDQESARILLDELDSSGADTEKVQVLRGYYCLHTATLTCDGANEAINIFATILESKQNYVPALVGLATAFLAEGSTNKARNTLKKIVKIPYCNDFRKEFEHSFLLLAQIYQEKGKQDIVNSLCQKCLAVNKSCSKAYLMMGADRLNNQSPSAGYTAAWALIEAGNHIEAIDVCNGEQMNSGMREELMHRCAIGMKP